MTQVAISWYILGDFNIRLDFSKAPEYENGDSVYRVFEQLREDNRTSSWHMVPAYQTLTISYPWNQSLQEVLSAVNESVSAQNMPKMPPSRRFEIPVCYQGDLGPDLPFVAREHLMSPDEVIRLHSQPEYRIEAIGFSPGFPYLSGLPRELATARRNTPRTRVPAGSVAIGGLQSGVYPLSTPGGWHLIGRTPFILFNAANTLPIPYQFGDRLHFSPISRDEYEELLQHPYSTDFWKRT